jgi:hypothetical protein
MTKYCKLSNLWRQMKTFVSIHMKPQYEEWIKITFLIFMSEILFLIIECHILFKIYILQSLN